MLTTWLSHPDFWKYCSIPVASALMAWSTNWLAVQMTFYPRHFVGIKPVFGWQGIIPAKAEKMGRIVVEKTLEKLGSLEEFFQEMEPEKIASHLRRTIQDRIEEYTDEVMLERNPVLWENLPLMVRRRIYQRARRAVPDVIDGLVADIGSHIEELVDLKHMVVQQMKNDTDLLIRIFKEVGEPEFRFVINSGLYFGFLFGLLQIPVFYYFPHNWVLPLFGFLVGGLTNWLALSLIFRPVEPVQVGPFRLQGLFLRRQKDVSEQFARITTTEMMTLRQIMQQVISGPRADRSRMLIKKHLRPLLDGGVVRTAAQLTVGMSGYAHLKKAVEEKAVDMSLHPFEDAGFNRERGAIVERMLCERMQELSSQEFQDLLRPAFQEDEWILISVGGFLGAVVGVLQVLLVFAS